MIERSNSNMALEKIFDELFNLINDATRFPLTEKIVLNESDLAGILDDLRDAIPNEIKTATDILEKQKSIINKAYSDADNIVQNAKNESERILSSAKAEADRMIQQEEVVRQANSYAEEIKAEAVRYAEDTKADAESYALQVKKDSLQYADDMLAYIGNTLSSAMKGLDDNRESISSAQQALFMPQAPEYSEEEEE